MPKLRLLINLPPGFHTAPVLKPVYRRLAAMSTLRRRSHNTQEEIAADLAWADAVLMWSWPVLTGEMLQGARRLQFCGHLDITQRGARALLERGLPVSISRRGFSPAVSETALTLILSTLRKTAAHQAAMRAGSEAWVERFPDDIDPDERELTGRPVGIVGFGAVGQGLADLLAPFRCGLRVYDPFLPDGAEARWGARRTDLPTLIDSSDVVVLCAASNAGTRHLLGRAEIRRFRRGAVLVNVARAALIDTAALVARLERGDLYAAIDVFDKEPLPADSPLRRLPNAFLTPHRAGGVLASVERTVGFLADDLEAHLAGRPRAHALTENMLPSLDA